MLHPVRCCRNLHSNMTLKTASFAFSAFRSGPSKIISSAVISNTAKCNECALKIRVSLPLVGRLVVNNSQEPDKTVEQRQLKRLKKQHGQSLLLGPLWDLNLRVR